MHILFDVQHLYYLPHYLPVMQVLRARGATCSVISRDRSDPRGEICRSVVGEEFHIEVAIDEATAVQLAERLTADWIIVGNTNPYWKKTRARTALLYHGNGVKSVYYSRHLMNVDLRFVEGAYRARELTALFPNVRLEVVGYPKLDPLLNGTADRFDLKAHGLDPQRRTLLYAPTFFPSSIECLPGDWPAQLADINLIIKPHQFSLTKSAYRGQQKLFDKWRRFTNVHFADVEQLNLVPYMAVADILVSETSTALFEFAALGRPVVWCDFLKLRWSYRGPFRYRLRRRIDQNFQNYAGIGIHASSPADLNRQIRNELEEPQRFEEARRRITAEIIGLDDGCASERVADVLLS